MSDEIMTLAGHFPPVTHDDWLEAVQKVLRGRSFDEVLRSTSADGIVIDPLYTADDAAPVTEVPGPGTSRRASGPAGVSDGWDVRQQHRLEDPAATNEAVLTDLARGVTSIELVLGADPDAQSFEAALDGVLLDLAPVALHSTGSGVAPAQRLLRLADERGVAPADLVADLGCDPIGSLAAHGTAGAGGIDAAVDAAVAFAADTVATHRRVRVLRADGVVYGSAGATPGTELAATVATGVAYVRALADRGLPLDEAFGQVLLSISVDTDQFGAIAKTRALRVMWARVVEASGVGPCHAGVQATMSPAILTTRDPWVNMLRGTLACFAAAVAGADIITIQPFDAAIGRPDDLGRRIARNTQLALMEESNLHRVIDPAGGSWYVESLTDELARAAWARFQDIERAGGIVDALRAGTVQAWVDEAWRATSAAVARRTRAVTGVSEFPDIDEAPVERPAYSPSTPDGPTESRPLPTRRVAAPFERLRDAAQAGAGEPTVFLANLGPVAVHTARATWAKNFFEAGGVRALGNDGFSSEEELAAAFSASGAAIAVMCSSDEVYQQRAVAAAQALRAAGASGLFLAGSPGEHRSAYEAAGVDDFVHVGCDAISILTDVHKRLGIDLIDEEDQR